MCWEQCSSLLKISLDFSKGIAYSETNFPHNLIITDRQVLSILKSFGNNSSTSVRLLKTRLSKTIQSSGFLGRLHGPLRTFGLSLMKNVLTPLAKIVLIPLRLTVTESAVEVWIHEKKFFYRTYDSRRTALTISDEEMKRIMKIVKSLGDSSLLIKGATCYSNNCKTKKGIKEDDFSVSYWHTRCNFIDKYVDR